MRRALILTVGLFMAGGGSGNIPDARPDSDCVAGEVTVPWPDPSRTLFQTIWTTAPDYVGPNCFGPNGDTLNWGIGLRCGPDQGSAQSEDQIGGNNDVRVDTPGWYTLQYYVCQSDT